MNNDDAPRYPCTTVADLATIPKERRQAMFADLDLFLDHLSNPSADETRFNALNDELKALGGTVVVRRTFVWIDDGDTGCKGRTTTIRVHEDE